MNNTSEQWERLTELLEIADAIPLDQRDQWLAQLTGTDAMLRADLKTLLAAVPIDDPIFGRPAVALLPDYVAHANLQKGTRLGAWSLVRELGRGGMGTVWEAERVDGDFAQRAAIKVVRASIDSIGLRERFLRERRVLARLQHRNIATLLDGGVTADGAPWFAMELVEGESILRWCDRKRLSVRDRLILLRQVCGAVQHAHGALVVHRDLKPGNILVTSEGTVKLLDFGIAKVLDVTAADDSATQPGSTLGTPAYVAPELLHGEPATVAADVYALGVIAYQLLSGHLPTGDPLHATNMQKRREYVTPLPLGAEVTVEAAIARSERNDRTLRDRLSGDLERIIAMALRAEPQRRYLSIEQFSEDIRRYLNGLPVLAQTPSLGYHAKKLFSRHRAAVVGAIATLSVLIAGLAATSWQAQVAREQRDRAQRETVKANRVRAFMEDIFHAADPRGQGKDVTVSQALERAEQKAETEFVAEPDVHAALLSSIGRTFLGLGRYDDANRNLTHALKLLRADPNAPPAEITNGVRVMAMLEAERGRLPQAESLYTEALRRVRH